MASLFSKVLLLLLVVGIGSCTNKPASKTEAPTNNSKIDPAQTIKNVVPDSIIGIYEGNFGSTFIHLAVTYANQHKAVGYNIHRGLVRNLLGNWKRSGDSLLLVMEEPGDNEFDGVFNLQFDDTRDQLIGSWKSKSGKITPKSLMLKRQKNLFEQTEKLGYSSDGLKLSQFMEYFNRCSGDMGDMSFDNDGLVTFNSYSNNDVYHHTEQEITIYGSWRYLKDKIQVIWNENEVFKKDNHLFAIVNDPDSLGNYIEIEQHKFQPNY